MFRRLFYLALGAVLGGYTVYRVGRSARLWSPGGIAQRVEGQVSGYRAALRELGEDITTAAERREAELRRAHDPGHPAGPRAVAGDAGGGTDRRLVRESAPERPR